MRQPDETEEQKRAKPTSSVTHHDADTAHDVKAPTDEHKARHHDLPLTTTAHDLVSAKPNVSASQAKPRIASSQTSPERELQPAQSTKEETPAGTVHETPILATTVSRDHEDTKHVASTKAESIVPKPPLRQETNHQESASTTNKPHEDTKAKVSDEPSKPKKNQASQKITIDSVMQDNGEEIDADKERRMAELKAEEELRKAIAAVDADD